METKYDMSAGIVKLDLPALKNTMAVATRTAHDTVEKYDQMIRAFIDTHARAERNSDGHSSYSALCSAHTYSEYYVQAAEHYAACIEAYFHLSEGLAREEVVVVRPAPQVVEKVPPSTTWIVIASWPDSKVPPKFRRKMKLINPEYLVAAHGGSTFVCQFESAARDIAHLVYEFGGAYTLGRTL